MAFAQHTSFSKRLQHTDSETLKSINASSKPVKYQLNPACSSNTVSRSEQVLLQDADLLHEKEEMQHMKAWLQHEHRLPPEI